ncbi:hypothetical protein AZI86_07135 [Bdellovibrio bacteriovorus]|uniref:Uncharacterized protein n=1 Tax=Bdellovibrio bacteriovorus TaxID=959 RepID=A0A150WR52_BDEBC|nr:hypothetical protein [Bdellovibrio bacteriovorus]KYG66804.1 hypothetical protein AZI86_07135 [Bdellovibrio bacteriovorus]
MTNYTPETIESATWGLSKEVAIACTEAALQAVPFGGLVFKALVAGAEGAIAFRNEQQARDMMRMLNERLDILEQHNLTSRSSLANNSVYQQVAQDRLLNLTALDTNDDLSISANMIAVCSLITGADPKDKYVLRALTVLTGTDFRILTELKRHRIRQAEQIDALPIVAKNDPNHKDYNAIEKEIALKFYDAVYEITGIKSFTHIVRKLHDVGLTEPLAGVSLFEEGDDNLAPPKMTEVGEYFLDLYNRTVNAGS